MAVVPSSRRPKRADLIVAEVKRWIMAGQLAPGDRLPNEKELMERFACSKGTIREALKSLEVQGLVRIRTGPGGGATLGSVSFEHATDLLRNYLHFQRPSGADLYALRKLVEPELAAAVVGRLDAADFARLEDLVALCVPAAATPEARQAQRMAELEFHTVLALRCDNPLLALVCRFLNDLVRDLVVYKKAFYPEQTEFSRSNLRYHTELIAAYRAEDAATVRRLMAEHMAEAERFNREMDAQIGHGGLLGARTTGAGS
ncbi:pyruvate dehydrogenase complex repressor [mine drainage metagenome]|uniref:Pyruvate dehydrogenase complex repressor n=1 Tax=mine drainage metagenome TaxID=410659 RepID=A0A1J5RKC3_9ZZZZ